MYHRWSVAAAKSGVWHSQSPPWKRRPQAPELLAALKESARGFTAIVVGEPQRVFSDNQLTYPLFVRYGVELSAAQISSSSSEEALPPPARGSEKRVRASLMSMSAPCPRTSCSKGLFVTPVLTQPL
jgi:hypothetical protein